MLQGVLLCLVCSVRALHQWQEPGDANRHLIDLVQNSKSFDSIYGLSNRAHDRGAFYPPSATLLLLLASRHTSPFHSSHCRIFLPQKTLGTAVWRTSGPRCHRRLLVSCKAPVIDTRKAELLAERKSTSREEWLTLLRLSAPEWPRITIALSLLIVASTCRAFIPALQSRVLNIALGLNVGSSLSLKEAISKLWIVGAVGAVSAAFRGYMFNICSARVLNRIRATLHHALLQQPQAFHDEQGPGALSSRLASDCVRLGEVFTTSLSTMLRSLVELIVSISIVSRLNVRLFGLVVFVAALRATITFSFSKIFRKASKEQQDVLAASSTVAEEAFSRIKLVKTHCSEAQESARYRQRLDQIYALKKKVAMLYGTSIFVGDSLDRAMYTGILWLGAIFLATGQLTSEGLSAFVFYADSISRCLTTFSFQWGSIEQAFGSASTVFDYLKPRDLDGRSKDNVVITPLPQAIPKLSTPKRLKVHDRGDMGVVAKRGALAFDDVDFVYPSRNQSLVLKGLSMSVKAGDHVALLGRSGCGKSTIFQLALGLYQPTKGSVMLDGIPLDQIDGVALSSSIAWVQQEPPLFPNLTITENIAYGLGDVPQSKIEAAAKEVQAYEFIRQLPNGFNTSVSAAGTSLSGGQKQRIALARALVRDPALLLLDEPTSALDPESAQAVEKSILRGRSNRTVIYTTHKLAQAQYADHIVVMSHGSIVEEGSYKELLRLNGTFAALLYFGDQELGSD